MNVPVETDSLHHGAQERLPAARQAESLLQASRALQQVYTEYEQEVVVKNNLVEKAKAPSQMTPREKRDLSDYNNMTAVMAVTENGKKEFQLPDLEFGTSGKSYENIPVEGLTDYLSRKMARMYDRVHKIEGEAEKGRDLTEAEKEEVRKLKSAMNIERQKLRTLKEHSLKLLDLPDGTEIPVPGSFAYERIAWEAYMISQNPLLASTNPDQNKRMQEDWLAASKALDRRRVIIDPADSSQLRDVDDSDTGILDAEEGEKPLFGIASQSELATISSSDIRAEEQAQERTSLSSATGELDEDSIPVTADLSLTPSYDIDADLSPTTTTPAASIASAPLAAAGSAAAPITPAPAAPPAEAPVVEPPIETPAPIPVVTARLSPAPTGSSATPDTAVPDSEPTELSTPEPAVEPESTPEVIQTTAARSITQKERYGATFMLRNEEIRKRARSQAIDQVNKELKQGSKWNPREIFRRAKVRWGEDYYTTKYTEIIMAEMIKNNTSLLQYDFTKKAADAVNQTQVSGTKDMERLTGQEKLKSMELLAQEDESRRLGQRIVDLDQGDAADKELKTAMFRDLLRPLADRLGDPADLGNATQEQKEEAMQVLFRKFVGEKMKSTDPADKAVKEKIEKLFGNDIKMHTADSLYLASSILEMTEEIVRERSAAAFADESLKDIIELKFAESTWVQGTDYQYKNTDKIFHWAKSHRVPLTPMAMAATFSIVGGVGAALLKSNLKHLAAPIFGTAVGAATAMLRSKAEENADMTKYRAERALGKVGNLSLKKHKEYERMSYNMKDYSALLNGAPRDTSVPANPDTEYDQKGLDQLLLELRIEVGTDYKKTASQDALLRRIGEMQARLELSMKVVDAKGDKVKERNDFIRFDEKTIDQDRMHMMKEYVEKRMQMTKILNEQIRAQMKNAGASDADIDLAVAQKAAEIKKSEDDWRGKYIADLLQNKKDKDKEFMVHKTIKALEKGLFGSAVGLVTGLGVREGFIWADRGAASGVEALANIGHDHLGLNNLGIIHNIQDYKHSLDGQSVVDKIFDKNSSGDILKRLSGFFEPTQTNGASEQYAALFNHAGSADLGSHYLVSSNANHELTIFDKLTNKPIDFPSHAPTIDQNGIMHIVGDKAVLNTDLPVDLRQDLTSAGFDIQPGPLDSSHEIFKPTGTYHAPLNGHDTVIPVGTEWKQDPSGQMDLVLVNPHDKFADGVVVMNDVKVQPDGTYLYDEQNSAFKMTTPDIHHPMPLDGKLVDSQTTVTPEQMWSENATQVAKIEGYNYNLNEKVWDPKLKEYIAKGHRVELSFGDKSEDDGTKFHAYMFPTADKSMQSGLVPPTLDIKQYFNPQHPGEHAAWSLIHPAGENRTDIISIKSQDDGGIVFDVNDTNPADKFYIYDPATNDYTKTVQVGDFSRMWMNGDSLSKFTAASQVGRNYDLMNIGNGPGTHGYGMLSAGQMVLEDKTGSPVTQLADGSFIHQLDGSAVADPSSIKPVWKSVAASIFDGTPAPIETGTPHMEITGHPISEVFKTWDIIPPKELVEVPFIPLPWDPRNPLEKLSEPEKKIWSIPEYFGYPPEYAFGYPEGRDTVEDYMRWIKNIGYYPKELPYVKRNGKWVNADGTDIKRDVLRERENIRLYLAKQEANHLKMIEGFANTLDPMGEEVRVAIVMPAYQEGKNIYRTLLEWNNQVDANGRPVDKSLFEIDIILNGPTGYTPDNTAAEIDRFKQDHPEMKINVISTEIAEKGGNVGRARKIMTDLTLMRSINRATAKGPLYLESEDADLMEIDKTAIFGLIQKLDATPELDALRGKQDLTPKILMENDYLFFDRRVERFIEYLLRDSRLKPENNENFDFYWNRNITGGWNTAYTAESYALIGGYQNAKVGEDVDIGRRISIMRGQRNDSGSFIPNVNTVGSIHNVGQSNPRRFIHALINKMPAYADFTNEETNKEIRSMSLEEMMDKLEFGKRITPENKKDFEDILTKSRQFLSWKVADTEIRHMLFRRLMMSMGFAKHKVVTQADGSQTIINGPLKQTGEDKEEWKYDYHINDNGAVVIDNIENIKTALATYRKKNGSTATDVVTDEEAVPTPLAPAEADVTTSEMPAEAEARIALSPENQTKVDEAKKSILEQAGKRNFEEITTLLNQVYEINNNELKDGDGKMLATINEMKAEQERTGSKEMINDHSVVYIPEKEGKITVIGDIHGDSLTVEKVLENTQFIEAMESGKKDQTLVFMGDYVDRGPENKKVMEILLELKRRYPNNVVMMRADHEVRAGVVSPQQFPQELMTGYGSIENGKDTYDNYMKLFDSMPHFVVAGNGLVIAHGGIPRDYDTLDLEKIAHASASLQQMIFNQMIWADPGSYPQFDGELSTLYGTDKYKVKKGIIGNNGRIRSNSGETIEHHADRAYNAGFISYNKEALQGFLSKVGGNVLVRGHQTVDDAPEGKEINFGGLLANIHTTGEGSSESRYQTNPASVAEFDQNTTVTQVTEANIIPVYKDRARSSAPPTPVAPPVPVVPPTVPPVASTPTTTTAATIPPPVPVIPPAAPPAAAGIIDSFKQGVQQAMDRTRRDTDATIERIRQDAEQRKAAITAEAAARSAAITAAVTVPPTATPTPTVPTTPVPTTAAATITAPVVATPPSAEILPDSGDLVDNINNRLKTSTESDYSVAMDPEVLAEYLETIPLPAGAKLKDVQMTTDRGKLILKGGVSAGLGGTTTFSLTIEEDRVTHKLKVVSKKINPAFIHRPFIGQVESSLYDIDNKIAQQLNSKLDPAWEVEDFNIGDNELNLNFTKKRP